jgi:protein RecA
LRRLLKKPQLPCLHQRGTGTDLELSFHIPFGIPTRVPALDLAMMRPGFPAGRVVEVYGSEGSGKTTIGLHTIAEAQRQGFLVLFQDTEKCFDPARARQCGVDPQAVVVNDANSIESIFRGLDDAMEAAKGLNKPLVCVIDSITGVPSELMFDHKFGEEPRVGADARAIKLGLRKLMMKIADNNTLAIFINHAVAKIGGPAFGDKSDSGGGKALKYFSAVRLAVSKVNAVTEGTKESRVHRGINVAFQIKKSKIGHNRFPKFTAELLENGFDLYSGLFSGFESIGGIERVNQTSRTYFCKMTEGQITRADWKNVVHDLGGPEETYDLFLQKAEEKGFLIPYGQVEKTELIENE